MLVRSGTVFAASVRASRVLHTGTLAAVLGAPMAFFDTTPTGRLLNRFSKDLQVVDMQLAGTLGQVLIFAFRIVGALYFIVQGSSLWILLSFPLIGLLYLMISRYYRASTRELQRLRIGLGHERCVSQPSAQPLQQLLLLKVVVRECCGRAITPRSGCTTRHYGLIACDA